MGSSRKFAAPSPILEYVKPGGTGNRHVWVGTNVQPGNGHLLGEGGAHIGEWRGRTSEGNLGVGMRM